MMIHLSRQRLVQVNTKLFNLDLTESKRSVLSKGLNFVPEQSKAMKYTKKSDVAGYFRRPRLHAHFNNGLDESQEINIEGKDPFETYK